VLEVALGQYRQSGLEVAQPHALADEVAGRCDTGPGVDVHLRLAEQATRKHRDGGQRRAAGPGHDVRTQRQLAGVPCPVVEHALVSAPLHCHVLDVQVKPFRHHFAFQQWQVAVVVLQRQCQCELGHDALPEAQNVLRYVAARQALAECSRWL